MANDLVIFENTLKPLAPHYEQALGGFMPIDRFMRTAIVAVERNPYLLECNRQSLFNTIMTAAFLGLEMDGVTGQCFPIPFSKRVQLVVGYRGYNTLGARAGLTITGEVVRDGDDFDYMLGSGGFIRHKPKLGNKEPIIGAWALASANDRPSIPVVMGIDDLLFVKQRSPGAKKPDSPWNDPSIGFPAMCSKTAKRRLARSTPLNVKAPGFQLAARMEEAFEEQGQHAFIRPDGNLVIEGETVESVRDITPTAEELTTKPTDLNDPMDVIRADGRIAAAEGTKSLRIWFEDIRDQAVRREIKHYLDTILKPMAEKADQKIAAEKAAQSAPSAGQFTEG